MAQPDPAWVADINSNRPDRDYGSGTFGFRLPSNVDPMIISEDIEFAARALSNDFYKHLGDTEYHYGRFFDVSEEAIDASALVAEHDVRNWDNEGPKNK